MWPDIAAWLKRMTGGAPADATRVRSASLDAMKQMATQGITNEQRQQGYYPRVSEALYNSIIPWGYDGHEPELVSALKMLASPRSLSPTPLTSLGKLRYNPENNDDSAIREDAWRMYLGLPQASHSYEISQYTPSRGSRPGVYYRDRALDKELSSNIGSVLQGMRLNPQVSPEGHPVSERYSGGLGGYNVTQGRDAQGPYLSYYDKWDLAYPGAQVIGHPFETYNRIYYDPQTYKPVQPGVPYLPQLH